MCIHRPLKPTKHNPLLLIIRRVTKTRSILVTLTKEAKTLHPAPKSLKIQPTKVIEPAVIPIQKLPKEIKLLLRTGPDSHTQDQTLIDDICLL